MTGNDDARIGILTSLGVPPTPETADQSVGPIILSGLLDLPSTQEEPFDPYRSLFACLLLAHLVRNSEHAKKLAREVSVSTNPGAPPGEDDDDKVGLVQLVVGNLMMAGREQTECANRAAKEGRPDGSTEEEDWTRVMVGYLVLLCTWLWDSPKTVKEFLSESANLQVVSDRALLTWSTIFLCMFGGGENQQQAADEQLIQPITQTQGIDPLVQGLSAFLLGVCYEFNREPGEITRTTLHPILHSRIGPDQFVSRMARLREDPRFKAVQPDAFVDEASPAGEVPTPETEELEEGLELWFDWAFVDFWKNHYCELCNVALQGGREASLGDVREHKLTADTIQRSIAIDPDAVRGPACECSHQIHRHPAIGYGLTTATDDGETAAIIMSLRQKLKAQTDEVVALQTKLSSISTEHKAEKEHLAQEVQALSEQVAHLSTTLQTEQAGREGHGAAMQELQASHGAELETIRKELEETQGRLHKAAEGEGVLEDVRAELGKAKSRVEELEKSAQASEDRAAAAEREVQALKAKVEEVEKAAGEVGGVQKELDAEKAARAGAQAELEKAHEEVKKAEARIKELEAEEKDSGSTGGKKKKGGKGAGGAGADGKVDGLETRLKELEGKLEEEKTKREEGEKEHEDLLVLLEELSQKRKKDKERMKESGMEVSEGEEDDEEEGDEE